MAVSLLDVLLAFIRDEVEAAEEDIGDRLYTDEEEDEDDAEEEEKLYGTDLKTLVVLSELASMMTGL